MPPTRKLQQNMSGVVRCTADGVFYANGRYRCQKLENGVPCNREMADKSHNISSHNSDFHTDSAYRRMMTPGSFPCYVHGCNHRSTTFAAILGHLRKRHRFRGSSNPVKMHYGVPLRSKKRKTNRVNQNDHNRGLSNLSENNREATLREDDYTHLGGIGGSGGNVEPDIDALIQSIDPLLLNWSHTEANSGEGGFGSDGSGLFDDGLFFSESSTPGSFTPSG
ncbi:hypothetical protein F5Y07DRAFT_398570 [Xylaria sp. FL0933]|nr:hypothetical protein F5Y07DRAFT_398570 [Xylaria sp. FL0933]